MACYIPRWYTRPVSHPGTNRARRALTWFMRRTPLTTTPRVDRVAYHVICASGTACTMHCSRTVSPTVTAVSLVSSPKPSGPYFPESSAVGSLNLGGTAANTRRHELTCQIHTTRLTALCPGLPASAGTREVKPIWILLKQETVSGSGISWAECKSAPRSRQITTLAPHQSVFL